MKTHYLLILSLVTLVPLKAQETNVPPPPPMEHGGMGGPMACLTKEERQKLKAAHDKAIQQDPSLDQKMKAAFEAMKAARQNMESATQVMHDAILKVDPTVEPILEKIAPRKWAHEKWEHDEHAEKKDQTNAAAGMMPETMNIPSNSVSTSDGPMHGGHGLPPGFANLTPDEQMRLKALHEKVKNDPSILAARQAEKSAATPEARHAAREATRKAVHDAMVKADPSIEPLLEKLMPPPPGSAGGDQGAPMMPPQ